MSDYGIGIDIGGTKIAGAVVDAFGVIQHRLTVVTPSAGGEHVVEAAAEVVERLRQQTLGDASATLRGIGIGTAGQVDFHAGTVLSGTTNIRDWNRVPIRETLTQRFGLPVFVDNDVNVMALTEAHLGAARGHRHVVCLTLGTGVGGGVLVDGQLLHGAFGAAAELGHVSVNQHGPMCNCGMRGCLELYASGTGLTARLQELWAGQSESPTTAAYDAFLRDPDCLTTRSIFAWMRSADVHATAVVEQMFQALAVAIVGFIHTFNPTLVVLGGGLLEDGTWICDEIEHRIGTFGMRSLVRNVHIQRAQFGTDAGVIGAAYQCFVYSAGSVGV